MYIKNSFNPFPYWIIDNYWDQDLLVKVESEFPSPMDDRWKKYHADTEIKLEGSNPDMWLDATKVLYEKLSSPAWISFVEKLTRISGLHPEISGGGYHQIAKGGKLNIHADFNISDQTGRYRRVNCLIYLNKNWQDSWKGHLELWGDDGCVEKISPLFNRTVLFVTNDKSFHGHPEPLDCPEDRFRRSFAVYYYTDEAPEGASDAHSTIFY